MFVQIGLEFGEGLVHFLIIAKHHGEHDRGGIGTNDADGIAHESPTLQLTSSDFEQNILFGAHDSAGIDFEFHGTTCGNFNFILGIVDGLHPNAAIGREGGEFQGHLSHRGRQA